MHFKECGPNETVSAVGDYFTLKNASKEHRPYELPAGTTAKLNVDLGNETKELGLVSLDNPVQVVFDANASLLAESEEPIAVFKLDSKERRDAHKQFENAKNRVGNKGGINLEDLNSVLYLKSQAEALIANSDAIPRIDAQLARDFLAGSPHQLEETDEVNVKGVELITRREIRPK